MNLACNAKNTTKIITAIEHIKNFMTQKNLSLQKVFELRMQPISQNKYNNFSTWEALQIEAKPMQYSSIIAISF